MGVGKQAQEPDAFAGRHFVIAGVGEDGEVEAIPLPRGAERGIHRGNTGEGGDRVFVVDRHEDGRHGAQGASGRGRAWRACGQAHQRREGPPCQPEGRREDQKRAEDVETVEPVGGAELQEDDEAKPGCEEGGREDEGADRKHPVLGGPHPHGLVPRLPQTVQARKEEREEAGARLGLQPLDRHGERGVGKGAQILGQTVEVELVRLRQVHHAALIH